LSQRNHADCSLVGPGEDRCAHSLAVDIDAGKTKTGICGIRTQSDAMKTLTLTVDESVFEEAQRLAAQQSTTVSAIFSRMVWLLSADNRQTQESGPLTKQATGLICLPERVSEHDVLADALVEQEGLGSNTVGRRAWVLPTG
jgi:hypothetical protein